MGLSASFSVNYGRQQETHQGRGASAPGLQSKRQHKVFSFILRKRLHCVSNPNMAILAHPPDGSVPVSHCIWFDDSCVNLPGGFCVQKPQVPSQTQDCTEAW